jgi:hypothetical protein
MKQKNQKKCLTKFSEGVLNDRHFSSAREKCVRVDHFFGEGGSGKKRRKKLGIRHGCAGFFVRAM